MKTILITGGLGYIGSSLVRHFKGLYNIVVVDNLMYNQSPLVYPILDGVEFHRFDITDPEKWPELCRLCDRADVIIPLAAIVGAPACEKEPQKAWEVNVGIITKLIARFNIGSYKPIVIFPNTNSGYGDTGGEVCTEDTPLRAISEYGKQKDYAEQTVRLYDKAVVFRLATVFGYSPRMRLDLLVNTLVFEAVRYCRIKIFDDSFMRNYIHIKDICRAFEFAIDNVEKMRGEVYNLGNDKVNMTKGDLVDVILKHLPDTKVVKVNGEDKDRRNYLVSSAKLYELGWTPKYDLDDGIKELIEYYTPDNLVWTDFKEEPITKLMINAGPIPEV